MQVGQECLQWYKLEKRKVAELTRVGWNLSPSPVPDPFGICAILAAEAPI